MLAQGRYVDSIDAGWKLRNSKQTSWMEVKLPCDVHTELIKRKMMANPYWGFNDTLCNVVDTFTWIFTTQFNISSAVLGQPNIELVLEGVDTYADVEVNGVKVGTTSNMHKAFAFNIKSVARGQGNTVTLTFKSAQHFADSAAALANAPLPVDSRGFARKAMYQFGYNCAPKLLTVGIYKPVFVVGSAEVSAAYLKYKFTTPIAKVNTTTWQFTKDNLPVYVRGINILPPSSLLGLTQKYYDSLIQTCMDLNVNLIRVWGGGVIPSEHFYNLCDENKIMVWQDFMFANPYIPMDAESYKQHVSEVEDNIRKLRHHPCIVLWCGHAGVPYTEVGPLIKDVNTLEGGQKLSQNFNKLFEEEIPALINTWDGIRSYVPHPPDVLQMGNNVFYKNWGVWNNNESINNLNYHTSIFKTEIGLQALPDIHSIREYCEGKNMSMSNPSFTTHQKYPQGFSKIRNYMEADYPLHKDSLGYIYFSQLAQRDAILTGVSTQMAAYPNTKGVIPWVLNDVWPGVSHSIKDFSGRPKAAYYALKKMYNKNALLLTKPISAGDRNIDTNVYTNMLTLCNATSELFKSSIKVYDMYGDMLYENKNLDWKKNDIGNWVCYNIFEKELMQSFNWGVSYMVVNVFNNDGMDVQEVYFMDKPNQLKLQPTMFDVQVLDSKHIKIVGATIAKDIYLYSSDPYIKYSDNYFTLLPNKPKIIEITGGDAKKANVQVLSQMDMMYE